VRPSRRRRELIKPDLPGILRDAIEELRAVLAPSDRLSTVADTARL